MAVAPYISHFSQREIRTIFKKARRIYSDPGLDILLYPSPLSYGRILVVTSRKIGGAPARNTVRRRLKALFYKDKLYRDKLDCFAIVKKQGVNYCSKKLQGILHKAFNRYHRKYNTQ